MSGKLETIRLVAQHSGFPMSTVRAVLDSLTDVATAELSVRNKFCIPGIGVLRLSNVPARTIKGFGREMNLPETVTVKFKVSGVIKSAVM